MLNQFCLCSMNEKNQILNGRTSVYNVNSICPLLIPMVKKKNSVQNTTCLSHYSIAMKTHHYQDKS